VMEVLPYIEAAMSALSTASSFRPCNIFLNSHFLDFLTL
jgi:hypothetical protein